MFLRPQLYTWEEDAQQSGERASSESQGQG